MILRIVAKHTTNDRVIDLFVAEETRRVENNLDQALRHAKFNP